jgi:transposase, IS30 family
MTTTYSQLTPEERDQLAVLRAKGCSLRQIASRMHRSPSSLSRELRRNSAPIYKGVYLPCIAQRRAAARKSSASHRRRLKSQSLRRYVEAKLRLRWSPELIAGRIRRELPALSISHEAIYQWIYADARHLIPFLPKSHRKRMRRGFVRGKHSKSHIPQRVPISLRPASVNSRRFIGHWEVDTAGNHKTHRVLLVVHERKTRLTKLRFLERRGASQLRRSIVQALAPLPAQLRRTLTYDNGTENCEHLLTNKSLGTRSFFCAPYHSWEKGSVENTIGILRLWLPKSFNLAELSHVQLRRIERWINTRPKKCLAFRTPLELFERLNSCHPKSVVVRSLHPAKRRR